MSKQDDTCDGWKNYATWNVALWIGNDEGLYSIARECRHRGYLEFVRRLNDYNQLTPIPPIAYQTPDGVAWNDSGLDIEALDEMIGEL